MKTTCHFSKLILLLFLLTTPFSEAQTLLEGYVFDQKTKKPLPYTAILIGNTGTYVTNNEDGRFRIRTKKTIDSLEIKHLGYQSIKVSTNYFLQHDIIYLNEYTIPLSEVTITATKENLYTLLYELVKKYRKKKVKTDSKAYYLVTSNAQLPNQVETKPFMVEQIEALYSTQYNLSRGLISTDLKTGRFGQSRNYPYYSLEYVLLLESLNLFKKGNKFSSNSFDDVNQNLEMLQKNDLLPRSPGTMSLGMIKKAFTVKLDRIDDNDLVKITFEPKNNERNFFSVSYTFDRKNLILNKVTLHSKNPKDFKLRAIVKTDSVHLKEMSIRVTFNPFEPEKIQYFYFDVDLNYFTQKNQRAITSQVLLYFYDYDSRFMDSYFTSTIKFKNDYDRFLATQVSDYAWRQNYPFPRSKAAVRNALLFKQQNLFTSNFHNNIPSYVLQDLKISTLPWKRTSKLNFDMLKIGDGANLNFLYAINPFKWTDGTIHYEIKTLLDIESSFFKTQRTPEELELIKIAFDIYESMRLLTMKKIKKTMSPEEVTKLFDKASFNAKITVKLMLEESQFGMDSEKQAYWKKRVHDELESYHDLQLDTNE